MRVLKNIKKIVAIGFIAIMSLGALAGCTQPGLTQEDVNAQIADAVVSARAEGYNNGVGSVDITSDNAATVATATVDKQAEIDRLNTEIAEEVEAEIVEEDLAAGIYLSGYVIDEIDINSFVTKALSDHHIPGLVDDEIDFDGDEYDVEESVTVTNLLLEANGEDFEGDVYLNIGEDGISYLVEFDSELDTDLITEDETLSFKFLGEKVLVSEFTATSITFTKGTELSVTEGESVEFEGESIKAITIGDDFIYVGIGDERAKIYEGHTEKVGDIEVKLVAAIPNEAGDPGFDMAEIEVGKNVEITVDDGEEYEKDSYFNYIVDGVNNKVGLILNEDFDELDEDEKPLAAGEELCFPNNYVCVGFGGLTVEDIETVEFELDTKDDGDYVEAKGNFLNGLEDYNRLFINASGIFDEDLLSIGSSIEVDDTGIMLVTNATDVVLNDVVIPLSLDGISVAGIDISSKDFKYITSYGFSIDNPDNSVEDNEFSIDIPEEQLYGEVYINIE